MSLVVRLIAVVCLFVFGALVFSPVTQAVAAEQVPATLNTNVSVQMDYLTYLPEDYESKDKWPLMLFLHGGGERGDDLELVKANGPPMLAAQGKDFPFIIVSPQQPTSGWWQPTELTALLDQIEKDLNVDADRIYVTGLSLGGLGTWRLANFSPDRFAAIAPICGGGEIYWADAIADMPIWAFHGAKDDVIPDTRTIEMVEAVRKAGGRAKLTIYPEADHDAWTETYGNPDFYTWLLAQTLQDRPARPAIEVAPIQLDPTDPLNTTIGQLKYRGGLSLSREDTEYGGYSGIWVSPDRSRIVAAQGGQVMRGGLSYDAAGNLAGFTLKGLYPLLDERGQPFTEEDDKDAEGIDFDGERYLVSFEGNMRVLAYDNFYDSATPIALPPEALVDIPPVAGLSSVATLADGTIITLSEYTYPAAPASREGYTSTNTRGWLKTADAEGPIWLRASNQWMPVSLARMANDDLLVLELYIGDMANINRARISRISRDQIAIGATMQATLVAELAPPVLAPKTEAIATVTGWNGETFIYVMSDTKGQNLIYMFELVEP
jgi:poly(3-hydroxybutyrate) depolymerase